MRFFPHLNQIKMTGIPIDVGRRDIDFQKTTEEKTAVREELRKMFRTIAIRFPNPDARPSRSRPKTASLNGFPGRQMRNSSPSNRDHVLGALTQRGILVENTQEAT